MNYSSKDSETVSFTLSSFIPISGIGDDYYANVSYIQTDGTVVSRSPYEDHDSWGNLSANGITIPNLIPKTQYRFTLSGFGHYHNGNKNDNIQFTASNPSTLDITTDNDSVYSNIGGQPIGEQTKNYVTKTLTNEGYIRTITANDYRFSKNSGINYTLEITFDGKMLVNGNNELTRESKQYPVPNASDQTSLNLSDFSEYNLNYFEEYQVTFKYTYSIDGQTLYAQKDAPSIDEVAETFILPKASPFPAPTLLYNGLTTDTVEITLNTMNNLYPISGLGGSVSNNYTSNVGYMKASASQMTDFAPEQIESFFGSIKFTFNTLTPNTNYTFKHVAFRHANPGIQISPEQPEINVTTSSDNVYSEINDVRPTPENIVNHGDNISKVFSGDNAYVSQINLNNYQFFTDAGSKVYNLHVQIDGDLVGTISESQSFEKSGISITHKSIPTLLSLTGWNFSLDWFRSYTLQFTYFNATDNVFATNNTNPANLVTETISIPAADPFEVPFEITSATPIYGKRKIEVSVTFKSPALSSDLTDSYSFTIVAIQDDDETNTVSVDVPIKTGTTIAGPDYTLGPVVEDGDYFVTIRNFVHYNLGGSESSRVQWDTGNISESRKLSFQTVTIHYDERILKPEIATNSGHTQTLSLGNVTFNDGGTNLEYDMLVRLEGTSTDVRVPNVQASSGYLEIDVSNLSIPHFANANIEFRFEDNVSGLVETAVNVLVYPDIAYAADPLVPPDGIGGVSPGVTSVSFDLLVGSFVHPVNIQNTYYANIEYSYDDNSIKYTDKNDWTTSNTTFQINNLVPNKDYVVKLVNFQHYYDGNINDTAIQFQDPTVGEAFTTSSDQVHSTINGISANIGYESSHPGVTTVLGGSDGRVSSITLPSFEFHTRATGKEYTMEISFSSGNIIYITPGSSTYEHSNVQDTVAGSNLVIDFANFYPKYFEDYKVSISYKNITDTNASDIAVYATNSNIATDLVLETFKIPGKPPFNSPAMSFDGNTYESVSFSLNAIHLPIDEIGDDYYVVINYKKNNSNDNFVPYEVHDSWGNLSENGITIPNLVPGTEYNFQFDEFGHYNDEGKNENILFVVPNQGFPNIATKSDNPRSQLNGIATNNNITYTVSKTINDQGGIQTLVFNDFQFFTDAPNKIYDLHAAFQEVIDQVTQETGNYVIENISSTHKTTATQLTFNDFSFGFTLDYFKEYTVSFSYENTNDDVFSSPETFTLDKSDPFPLPNISAQTTTEAPTESITVSLVDTGFVNSGLSDNYYANVGYYKTNEESPTVQYVTPQTGNLGSISFTQGDLVPNTSYTFELAEFGHSINGSINDKIQFGNQDRSIELSTENDDVYTTINETPTHQGADIAHNLDNVSTTVNNQALIGNITLKNFKFNTQASSKDYKISVSFNGTMFGDKQTLELSISYNHSGNLEINCFPGVNLKYFEDYEVQFSYLNTTDNVYAVDDDGNIITDSFKLPRGENFQNPVVISSNYVTNTATTINIGNIQYTNTDDRQPTDFNPYYTYNIRAVNESAGNVDTAQLTHLSTSAQITGLSPEVTYQLKVVEFAYANETYDFLFDTEKDLQINVQTNTLSGPTTLNKGSETVDGARVWFGTEPGETGTLLGSDLFTATFTAASTNNTLEHINIIDFNNLSNYSNYFSSAPPFFNLSNRLLPNTTYTITLTSITHQTTPNYNIQNSSPSVSVNTLPDQISYDLTNVTRTLKNDEGNVGSINIASPTFSKTSPYTYQLEWTIGEVTTAVATDAVSFSPSSPLNYFDDYDYTVKVVNDSFSSAGTYYAKNSLNKDIEVSGSLQSTTSLGNIVSTFSVLPISSDNSLKVALSISDNTFLPSDSENYEHDYSPYDLYRITVRVREE